MENERAASLWSVPNLLSLVRLPLAVIFACALYLGDAIGMLVAFAAALLAIISDGLDGWAARKMNLVSDFGKLFDPLADALFFVIAFAGLAWGGLIPWWLALPFLLRELLQHLYLRPTAKRHGLAMGAKLIGKLKTVAQALVVLLIVALEWLRMQPNESLRLGLSSQLENYLWWYFGLVAIAASLSVGSIVPYIATVSKLRRESPETTNP